MAIEDGKPLVCANACSRMDLDLITFIDEDGYEDYYVGAGEHPEMSLRYGNHLMKIKEFDYKNDLKFISDVKK